MHISGLHHQGIKQGSACCAKYILTVGIAEFTEVLLAFDDLELGHFDGRKRLESSAGCPSTIGAVAIERV